MIAKDLCCKDYSEVIPNESFEKSFREIKNKTNDMNDDKKKNLSFAIL